MSFPSAQLRLLRANASWGASLGSLMANADHPVCWRERVGLRSLSFTVIRTKK